MNKICPRVTLFILILISLGFISTTKAQAKAPYGSTWTIGGTSSTVTVAKIATDSANNVYYAGVVVTGGSSSIAFNPDGISDVKTATDSAVYLTKINNDGTYGYTRLYDGASYMSVRGLKTDSNGNVYLLGVFQGIVNFDPVGSTDILDSRANDSSFITKLDTNGNYQYTLSWIDPVIQINDMTLDASNNIYLGGIINSATPDAQLDQISFSDNKTLLADEQMGFYLKLNFDGTYAYSKSFLATSAASFSLDHITLDSNANVYLSGNFSNAVIFDGPGGTNLKTNTGMSDIYVSKYNSSGNYVLTYTIGGIDNDYNKGLEIDHSNNLYILGTFNNNVNFDPIGATDPKVAAFSDEEFLTKINANGTYAKTLVWNSSNSINIRKVAFDANDLIYIIGAAPGSINFDPTGGTDIITGYGFTDMFMTVLNADETYNYTYLWGGSGSDDEYYGFFDTQNNIYIGGSTQSPTVNYNPTSGGSTDIKTLKGDVDGALTKFLTSQTITVSQSPTPIPGNTNSQSSGGSGSFTCTNPWPSAPVLFQISAIKDKATLYYAPPADSETGYTISYGSSSDADMYNVTFPYTDKSGAISYTINYLSPNITYYFKVRANNDCMPGLWSKILSAKTPFTGTFTSYYSPTNSFNNGATGQCTQYTVRPGDSLWTIAQKLLGSGKRFLELWRANTSAFPTLNNSSIIRTGWNLSVGC
jgi:hypothetical protein